MPVITLRLSESLLSIFRDAGAKKEETCRITVEKGTTVRTVLAAQAINPLLVPMAGFSKPDTREQQRIDLDTPLTCDGTLTLYGPLAGG
ncbi:MAG TPA: hypothetical protein DHV36_23115 [Desulfobacteraceae bacterium]|nr:hypothetical protein [Desulfobacteraceae bacterium]